MKPHWFFLALVATICALIATASVQTSREDIAVLDRLAPQIEHSHSLTPEARDAIMHLVDRATVPTGDPRFDQHRSATVERVTAAIKGKDASRESGTVGLAPRK